MEYKWIAQDSDGEIFKHRVLPEEGYLYWLSDLSDELVIKGELNPNWQDSLINLETHDYKIEDGILMKVEKGDTDVQNMKNAIRQDKTKRHKHADLIHAWADGAEIEYMSSINGEWRECAGGPSWNERDIYRIKPKTKTVRFRVYLDRDNLRPETTGNDISDKSYFIKWIGDWQSIEVEQ